MRTLNGRAFLASSYLTLPDNRFSNKPEVTGYAKSILIDSFEYATIPVSRTTPGKERDQWEIDEYDSGGDPRLGYVELVTSADSTHGDKLLRAVGTGGSPGAGAFKVRYYNNHTSGASNYYNYIHETINMPPEDIGRYNRLRFWMKPPSSIRHAYPDTGQHNFHFGCFLLNTDEDRGDPETAGYHMYHYFNFDNVDNWIQVIIDTHPSHIRHHEGKLEEGRFDIPFPVESPNHTYFDVMTYFYLASVSETNSYPCTWDFDGFEFFEETHVNEDIDNIYSLHGVLSKVVPNEIVVGWKRLKTRNDQLFYVKYAFTSFYENGGWSHGVDAPDGQGLEPVNSGGHNGVEFRTTGIDMTGKTVIYIAIKDQDEAVRFRQIRIPLVDSAYPVIGGV